MCWVQSEVSEHGGVKKIMQSHFEKWFFRERNIFLILFDLSIGGKKSSGSLAPENGAETCQLVTGRRRSGVSKPTSERSRARVARFFLVQIYQNGKNIPNDHKLYQKAVNYTKWS
jgi:hypothetical protein